MKLSVKSKIWLTVFSIVLVFTLFLLLFFPAQQQRYFLRKYDNEIENLAKTVALGVKIAMTEQNFEGVQMALDFAKADERLEYIALIQTDTVRDAAGRVTEVKKNILNTYPQEAKLTPDMASTDAVIVKRAAITSKEFPGEVMVGFTTDEIAKNMRQIRIIALVVSFIVFLFGIAIGYWLARTISRPVLALRDAAIKVGAGDRSQHVQTRSGDEIGQLSEAFNRMVAELSAAEERDRQKAADLMEKNRIIEQNRDELAHALHDLKQTQSQLVQSEKMASLGQLTAGVAHEINNPINFVSGGIDSLKLNFHDVREVLDQYLELKPEDDNSEKLRKINRLRKEVELEDLLDEMEQLFKSIKNGANRTTEIVKSLRNFTRLDEDNLKKASLEEGLDSTLVILQSQLKDRVEIVREYSHLPEVCCYPGQMNQVFMNILTNAIQAIDGPGQIRIRTAAHDGEAEIRIKDSGKGMSEDVRKRIFDPFFTTKDVGVGTGLGLSISFGIIEKHKGRIEVDSAPGAGTEFIIRIPLNLN